MKEIKIVEYTDSAEIINSVKHLIHSFMFEGGYLYFLVLKKNYGKVVNILKADNHGRH